MADADRDQLGRRARLNVVNHPAEMAFKVVAWIDRERGIIDRRTVRDHHQNLALLAAGKKPPVCPVQRLPVDVLLEQTLAHHEAQILARPPPRAAWGFVDEVAKMVEPPRIGGFPGAEPRLA